MDDYRHSFCTIVKLFTWIHDSCGQWCLNINEISVKVSYACYSDVFCDGKIINVQERFILRCENRVHNGSSLKNAINTKYYFNFLDTISFSFAHQCCCKQFFLINISITMVLLKKSNIV